MIITNSRYALVGYFITSYPTRAHGIIVKYLVCYFQSTLATIDIPFLASITNRTRFIENISGVFPRLERRIYTYILSVAASALLLWSIFLFERYSLSSKNYEPHAFHLLLAAHTCYDRYFFSSQFYERHARFIENISGVFPHLERRIHTYILSVSHTLCSLQARITNRTRLSTLLQSCLLIANRIR